ncbi:MAG: DinB family protein [Chloroflexota bacterium]
MSKHNRQQQLDLYGNAYTLLTQALAGFPKEMWSFRPTPDRWTIHEIVVHIADSEANGYIRLRKLIAEPGTQVAAYDEPKWASALHYSDQNPEDALALFKLLRQTSYQLVQSLPESTWAHTVEHSEAGTITLDDWLDTYADHIMAHIRQMQENYELWMQTQAA